MKTLLVLGAIGIGSVFCAFAAVSIFLVIAVDADPTPGGRKAMKRPGS